MNEQLDKKTELAERIAVESQHNVRFKLGRQQFNTALLVWMIVYIISVIIGFSMVGFAPYHAVVIALFSFAAMLAYKTGNTLIGILPIIPGLSGVTQLAPMVLPSNQDELTIYVWYALASSVVYCAAGLVILFAPKVQYYSRRMKILSKG